MSGARRAARRASAVVALAACGWAMPPAQAGVDGNGDGIAACDIGPVEGLDEHVFGSGLEAAP